MEPSTQPTAIPPAERSANHWESLRDAPLREHSKRVGVPLP